MPRALLARLVPLARKVPLARLVRLAPLVRKVPPARLARQVLKALLALSAPRVRLARMETRF